MTRLSEEQRRLVIEGLPKNTRFEISPTGCWNVIGRKPNASGYYEANNRTGCDRLLHRISYKLAFNDLKPEEVVRHQCDNRGCINPEHLLKGSHADNVRDRVERNRSALGTKNGRAKLTEEDVRSIKNSNIKSGTALANYFGVTRKVIYNIRAGNTWKHVS